MTATERAIEESGVDMEKTNARLGEILHPNTTQQPAGTPAKPPRKQRSDAGAVRVYIEIPGARYDLLHDAGRDKVNCELKRAIDEGDAELAASITAQLMAHLDRLAAKAKE